MTHEHTDTGNAAPMSVVAFTLPGDFPERMHDLVLRLDEAAERLRPLLAEAFRMSRELEAGTDHRIAMLDWDVQCSLADGLGIPLGEMNAQTCRFVDMVGALESGSDKAARTHLGVAGPMGDDVGETIPFGPNASITRHTVDGVEMIRYVSATTGETDFEADKFHALIGGDR